MGTDNQLRVLSRWCEVVGLVDLIAGLYVAFQEISQSPTTPEFVRLLLHCVGAGMLVTVCGFILVGAGFCLSAFICKSSVESPAVTR
jgi:hypothetical protein